MIFSALGYNFMILVLVRRLSYGVLDWVVGFDPQSRVRELPKCWVNLHCYCYYLSLALGLPWYQNSTVSQFLSPIGIYINKLQLKYQCPKIHFTVYWRVLTSINISEYIVALFWECDFVDRVSDKSCFQQVTGILPGVSSISKTIDMSEQPVHQVWACNTRQDLDSNSTCHIITNHDPSDSYWI